MITRTSILKRPFVPHQNIIVLTDFMFAEGNEDYASQTVVHEWAHIWDLREGRRLSKGMASLVRPDTTVCVSMPFFDVAHCTEDTDPPAGSYGTKNPAEDFAQAFFSYIYPLHEVALNDPIDAIRADYLRYEIDKLW